MYQKWQVKYLSNIRLSKYSWEFDTAIIWRWDIPNLKLLSFYFISNNYFLHKNWIIILNFDKFTPTKSRDSLFMISVYLNCIPAVHLMPCILVYIFISRLHFLLKVMFRDHENLTHISMGVPLQYYFVTLFQVYIIYKSFNIIRVYQYHVITYKTFVIQEHQKVYIVFCIQFKIGCLGKNRRQVYLYMFSVMLFWFLFLLFYLNFYLNHFTDFYTRIIQLFMWLQQSTHL